jgi:ubiquinone/menaquinone biosynthesis C-methylase UbiE
MSYFSLTSRVPEASAVEPRSLTWLYESITRVPLVRRTHQRFIAGVLAQGANQGLALDLGTGPGYVAVEIAQSQPGLSVTGLDLAAHMVRRARQQALRAGLDGRGLWPQADGQRLPFADATFNLVISSFALHHWHDPVRILDEIARVLAPGGRYYIADLCREVSLLQRLFAYASIPAISLAYGSYLGYGGYYESVRASYTRQEAKVLLEQSALPRGAVEVDSTHFVPVLVIASEDSA